MLYARIAFVFMSVLLLSNCTSATRYWATSDGARAEGQVTRTAEVAEERPNKRVSARPKQSPTAASAQRKIESSPSGSVGAATRLGETPKIGTPEWEREQAEEKRRDEEINRMIRNICRGC